MFVYIEGCMGGYMDVFMYECMYIERGLLIDIYTYTHTHIYIYIYTDGANYSLVNT